MFLKIFFLRCVYSIIQNKKKNINVKFNFLISKNKKVFEFKRILFKLKFTILYITFKVIFVCLYIYTLSASEIKLRFFVKYFENALSYTAILTGGV